MVADAPADTDTADSIAKFLRRRSWKGGSQHSDFMPAGEPAIDLEGADRTTSAERVVDVVRIDMQDAHRHAFEHRRASLSERA